MGLKIATAPAVEPISSTEAKLHLRVDVSTDDTLITNLIVAARKAAERILWRALCTQTWDLYLDAVPASDVLKLSMPPLQSVTYVKYTPLSTGVAATFAAASYTVDAVSEPGRIVLNDGYSWPADSLIAANGFNVRFVCGYGVAAAVPETIKQAMLFLIGYWYENREDVGEVPKGIENLLLLESAKEIG